MRVPFAPVALIILLLQTGCDRPDAPPAGAASPDRTAVALLDPAGVPAATLGCTDGALTLTVPVFQPIGSEDRLSLGAEGESFALVADLDASGPGVTAAGAPDPDLLDRMARGAALFASYGRQTAGPLVAASPAGLQAMISACQGGG